MLIGERFHHWQHAVRAKVNESLHRPRCASLCCAFSPRRIVQQPRQVLDRAARLRPERGKRRNGAQRQEFTAVTNEPSADKRFRKAVEPGGCERPKHFAVVRHQAVSGELFWRYGFVVGAAGMDPRLRFEHHRLKGDKERAFSELLRDWDLHHPPCADLEANRLFYGLAGLADNVLQALKLIHLPESEQPKRVGTLIRHLLLVPVELKRHARRLKACLFVPAGWVAWWRGFLAQLLPQCRQLGGVVTGTG